MAYATSPKGPSKGSFLEFAVPSTESRELKILRPIKAGRGCLRRRVIYDLYEYRGLIYPSLEVYRYLSKVRCKDTPRKYSALELARAAWFENAGLRTEIRKNHNYFLVLLTDTLIY